MLCDIRLLQMIRNLDGKESCVRSMPYLDVLRGSTVTLISW